MAAFNFACFLSVALFWTASAMIIAMMVIRKNHESDDFTRESYTQLEPNVIQTRWDFRESEKSIFYASGFINGIFWIIFCIPICEMAWVLSSGGKRSIGSNVGIAIFAIGGAIIEWVSHLFWVGTSTTSLLLAADFNLNDWLRDDIATLLEIDGSDGLGWRTLEVNHIVSSGMIWIVGTFEWLALTGLFSLTFYSVLQWRKDDVTTFGPRWNALGLFIACLCILEFAGEIVRFEGYRFASPFIILYAAINRLILIPAWMISLGYQLPQARKVALEQSGMANVGVDLSLSEVVDSPTTPNNGASKRHSDFSIDEDGDGVNTTSSPPARSSPPKEAFANVPPPVMTEDSTPFPVTPSPTTTNGN